MRPLTLRGTATNSGSNTQSGVQLKAIVGSTQGYSDTLYSDTISLTPGMSQEILIPDYLPPGQIAEYAISFELMSDSLDENPDDNFGEDGFEISVHTFARDRGVSEGDFKIQEGGFEIGSFFHFENSIEVNCLYAGITAHSDLGAYVGLYLRNDQFEYLYDEGFIIYALPPNSEGSLHFDGFCLNEGLMLNGGEDYFASIAHYGGPNQVAVAVENDAEPNSSFIYYDIEGMDEWVPSNVKPLIRMGFSQTCLYNLGCIGGVESKEQIVVSSIYPNPASHNLRLEYTLLESTPIEITITDVNGRIVQRESQGRLPVGEHQLTFDIQHFTPGMYALNMIVEGEVIAQKFVVQR